MAKIKAVLDQETWVAVDIPEEFQVIVLSLPSTEVLVNDVEMPGTGNNSKLSEDGVFTTIVRGGVGYHMVNWLVI